MSSTSIKSFIRDNGASLGALIVTFIIIGVVYLLFDPAEVKVWIEASGAFGPLVLIFIKAFSVVFAPVSGAPVYPLAGAFFGFGPGWLYIIIGDFIGFTSAFVIGRFFGRKVVDKILSSKEEGLLSKIIGHISTARGFFHACLTCFALPEVLAYGAGLSRLPYWKFILILWPASTVGAAALVYVGSFVGATRDSFALAIGVPIVATFVILFGGWLFIKGVKKHDAREKAHRA